jgi:hypothetical protein
MNHIRELPKEPPGYEQQTGTTWVRTANWGVHGVYMGCTGGCTWGVRTANWGCTCSNSGQLQTMAYSNSRQNPGERAKIIDICVTVSVFSASQIVRERADILAALRWSKDA